MRKEGGLASPPAAAATTRRAAVQKQVENGSQNEVVRGVLKIGQSLVYTRYISAQQSGYGFTLLHWLDAGFDLKWMEKAGFSGSELKALEAG